MRVVLSCVIACLAFSVVAAPTARAQYPIYAPQGYGNAAYPHHHHHHHHHGHYSSPSTTQYYSGYGGSAYQYAAGVGYPPVYGAGAVLAQPVAPPGSIYYSNSTYYNVPPAQLRHGWHLGHYLLGN
jgi:hypothetical protein